MKRREFLLALGGGALLPFTASAQSHASMPRLVGYSAFEPEYYMREDSENRYIRTLFAELRRLGRVEGKTLIFEKYGKEKTKAGERKEIVKEIVDSRPDVIFVVGDGLLFKQATDKIPIVALSGDPIEEGLVKSLAHPGGNITGVALDAGIPIHGKRIALLREMFPGLTKLAFLGSREILNQQGDKVRAAAEALGVAFEGYPFDLPGSATVYRDAIAKAKGEGVNGIMIAPDIDTAYNMTVIVELVRAVELPAIYPIEEYVPAGGLMAYAFDLVELNRRIASNIDAILKGANPGDIPFYQPTKFELSINLKAAKALSLVVPATLLTAADEVIE
jgi:putative tryptophan/tyrosine transport system substrate-binding protein